MMQEAVVKKIRNRISRSKFGEVFFVSSFSQYDTEYVTKLLAVFEKEGLISRISKGVYVKARKTRFGVLYPSAYELVTEIAKRDKAVIIPTGETAANQLGFSTQIPMTTSFLTSGSSRKLTMGKRMVILERCKVPHDKDPSVIFIKYPSLYKSDAAYATPTVKIEISVLSMAEPFEKRRISSLVEQSFSNEDVDSDMVEIIPTVTPTRTFLEKAFLLCEEYQKTEPRTHRMTRHFYDLEKLMQTEYAEIALNDVELYKDIVNHRRKFYHVGYVDYNKDLPQSIKIVPSDELMASYEADYNEMRKSFIYGDSLDFAALMERMEKLQGRFRNISNK